MGKAPAPPDPKDTSAAQSSSNFLSSAANTYAQNGSFTDANGNKRSTTFSKSDVYDPYTGKTYQAVTPNTTETLSPEQQAIQDQNNQAKLGYGKLANSQIDKLQTTLKDPFTFNDTSHTSWANGLYDKINGQHLADQKSTQEAQLANMGIHIGDPAYNKAMLNLQTGQDQARNQFILDSYGQDQSSQLATRNQNVNESTALATGGQVQTPNLNYQSRAGNVATTDNAGIIKNNYEQQLDASKLNGVNLGGILGGVKDIFALSDERAKNDMEKVGEVEGQNVYKFKYKKGMGPKGIQLGLKAQDVEKNDPDAVITGRDGLKRVNYSKALGIKMGA